MGISNLYDIIRDKAPECFIDVKLQDLRGFTLAIDVSIYLYRYIRSTGDGWLDLFLLMFCKFKMFGIIPIFIFDGVNVHEEKKVEQASRRANMSKLKHKLEVIKLLKDSCLSYRGRDLSLDLQEQFKLLFPKENINIYDSMKVVEVCNNYISKLSKQTIDIGPECKEQLKKLIDICGFSYIQCDGEAEGVCSIMCKEKIVDGVLSEDTDTLAYGASILCSKLDIRRDTVILLKLKDILKKLEMTHESFLDMCILLGCDYNIRPKGFGPKYTYKMIQKYQNIENIENNTSEDIKTSKYEVCRDIFTNISLIDMEQIKKDFLCKPLNEDILKDFLKEINTNIDYEFIINAWDPNK